MDGEYVKQDVFNETMKRIETMIAASEAKHEKAAAEIQQERIQMQKEFQEAKHQYEIDSVKRDERYEFLHETFMRELQHTYEYVDAKFFKFEFFFAIFSFLVVLFEFFKR